MQLIRSDRFDARARVGFVTFTLMAASARAQSLTERASVDSEGHEVLRGSDYWTQSRISADGRFVAFDSEASGLVRHDTNGVCDVFVRDRLLGRTERVSVDSTGVEFGAESHCSAMSADGRYVVFTSADPRVFRRQRYYEIALFLHDRATGRTECVSVDRSGAPVYGYISGSSISADGRFVAFSSDARDLVAGDTNRTSDIFVRDRSNGTTERVSVDSNGVEADRQSYQAALSADGRFVAFDSYATNLVAGDTNGVFDVFVHDRISGATERVSVRSDGSEGDNHSVGASISADGRFVAFDSDATNLVASDLNGTTDVFVHDRIRGTTECAGVDSSGRQVPRGCGDGVISADGNVVAFSSTSKLLDSGDDRWDPGIFVHDLTSGQTECVSVAASGIRANGGGFFPSLSGDGRVVAFLSWATNLVDDDRNNASDVFVHERCTTDASWSNYGAGVPGTAGVPTFTARVNPAFGTTVPLDLGNSRGGYTVAVLFVGFERAVLPSSWSGELLVVPAITSVLGLPPHGAELSGDIPNDQRLCGVAIDLQALEADPGAVKGVSFTAGLELVVGH